MRLILEVISANGDVLGSNRSKTIGPEGAQIGRSKESDWVINDPYISRTHARIRFVNGAYYVEGAGRNPLALNDPSNVVPNNQSQLLRTGDRFFLDQYEIRATVEVSSEPAVSADPLVQESDSATVRVAPVIPVQPVRQYAEIGQQHAALADSDDNPQAGLDPLVILNAGRAPSAAAPLRPANVEHASLPEHHESPPPRSRVSAANDPTPAIPANESVQRTAAEHRPSITHLGPAVPHLGPTTRKVAPGPAVGGQNAAGARSSGKALPPGRLAPASDFAAGQSPAVVPTTPLHVGATPPPERSEAWFNSMEEHREARANPFERPMPQGFSKTINRASQPASAHAPPAEQATVPPRETHSTSLEYLLAAAGVPESQLAPELAQELGEVLRVVVQGVMEVLQSRAEIKSQLRMNMTLMKPVENNPLKFSPNVEAALHTLLVERNRGYLPTVRAFQEALTDIRHHQIAVLQGIRSAFNAMLEQFNPVRLEQEFERHGAKRGLLNVGAKSRFRDSYVEEFERLARDPEESFKRLFGEYFAQAYEDQMEQLKAAVRNDAH